LFIYARVVSELFRTQKCVKMERNAPFPQTPAPHFSARLVSPHLKTKQKQTNYKAPMDNYSD